MSQDLESFLKELSELTKKYNVEIVGCGCCGSPWVIDSNSCHLDNLSWDEKTKKYTTS